MTQKNFSKEKFLQSNTIVNRFINLLMGCRCYAGSDNARAGDSRDYDRKISGKRNKLIVFPAFEKALW
jgi:hypothetical protein|tara:strand:- start:200 stop:403 length:204 start_codon:yes stop_codon:yes gene_type:complete